MRTEAANVSDRSTLSSLVVFSHPDPKACSDRALLWGVVGFVVRYSILGSVLINFMFGNIEKQRENGGTVSGSGKGLQKNISHKIAQQCLCKHVLAR